MKLLIKTQNEKQVVDITDRVQERLADLVNAYCSRG